MAVGGRKLEEFLKRHRRIGLDTSVFIFHIETNPRYLGLVDPLFGWLEGSGGQAVTSTLTMMELLVQTYRLSDIDRVNKFYGLLSTYPHLEWVAPVLEIADLGAKLRAEFNLRTPDALQAATALFSQATGFISNDAAFQRVHRLDVIILDQLRAP